VSPGVEAGLLTRDPAGVPDVLPGEPPNARAEGARLWVRAVLGLVGAVGLLAVLSPAWMPYGVLAAIHGRPPVVPRAAQFSRYLRATWNAAPPPPGLSLPRRLWITSRIVQKAAWLPVRGAAWLFDEVLYGRALDAQDVSAPLFEVSAGRSGSTQLARSLEDDPRLAAPSLFLAMFPYLWLHRLVSATVGRVVSPDTVRHTIETTLPKAFVERHEVDPFRTDTFDGALFTAHLNELCFLLGPDLAAEDFSMGRYVPANRALWEEDFPALLERIGRKRLLQAGPDPEGRPRRLFVKGHFLAGAPALARRFPDARFLTMIRRPGPRIQSGINYIRVNPADTVSGAPPWSWLVPAGLRTEVAYCEAELAWFTAAEGPRRCVVRFTDFVADLEGTLRKVYAECLDTEPPDCAPREHPPRRRTAYTVDRSLEQLGVDAAALDIRLADYLAWCDDQVSSAPDL
jgi:hypothetical protein